jgi:hypothetical protein
MKIILSLMVLAGLAVLSIPAVLDGSNSLMSSAAIGQPPFVMRVGMVTAYAPGSSITIQAKDGKAYTFSLPANPRILPWGRGSQLVIGAQVTIIARYDPHSDGGWLVFGIVVHPGNVQSPTPTVSFTALPTMTETRTAGPGHTATSTAGPTDTATSTAGPTNTTTPTAGATGTSTPTAGATDTPPPSHTATNTPDPTP